MTFVAHAKATPKVTQKWLFGHFWVTFGSLWSLLSHCWVTFGVTLGWPPKVTFESLFCDSNCFGVWGVLWGQEGHNSGPNSLIYWARTWLYGWNLDLALVPPPDQRKMGALSYFPENVEWICPSKSNAPNQNGRLFGNSKHKEENACNWDLAHRNRSDFCDLRLRCPSRTPEIAAISETRDSNDALRFKGAMESR